jgi:deazaflavin-dependent oxidoreductase (nitroreductase family)
VPFPRTLARLNKAGLNRLTRHTAPLTPGMGTVVHRGRRTGREYQTPVNVFRTGDGYLFALTYGPASDWVQNVLAAGACELRTRRRTIALTEPRLLHDEKRAGIRPVERQVLRLMRVTDFLQLTES